MNTLSDFWFKVDTSAGVNDCWPWKRYKDRDGYGRFRFQGRQRGSHQVAFYAAFGCWPEVVYHSCDFPTCCNPRHLSGGTQRDNMEDAARKGRFPDRRGENCVTAKLKGEDVMSIRREYKIGKVFQNVLARRYGVSTSAINDIVLERKWRPGAAGIHS